MRLGIRLLVALSLAAGVWASTAFAQSGPDKVRLQIKWVPQAQFAGYFVALDKGFYSDENLDVQIIPGGPDIITEQQVANDQADFGVDWVASFLAFRDKGLPLIDVAQVYQSSGLMLVSRKAMNIAADICVYTNHNLVIEKL